MGMFESIPKEAAEKFQSSVSAVMRDSKALERICHSVSSLGFPTYYPEYMLAHGMGAVISGLNGKAPGPGFQPSFDSAKTWKDLQISYLNCSDSSGHSRP
jgi:hypothetical protein